MKPSITSEYSKLKKVLVHTPGAEHRHIIPWTGDHHLMGPNPRVYSELKKDHHALKSFIEAEIGAENVLELRDLLIDIFDGADYRQRYKILQDTLYKTADMYVDHLQARGIKLENYEPAKIVRDLIEGYPRKLTLNNGKLPHIIIPPKRELMWMRDSSATIASGVIITSMASARRRPEPSLVRSLFKYHPEFGPESIFLDMVQLVRDIESDYTASGLHEHLLLEGGNILVLSEEVIAIGVGRYEYLYSNRTTRQAFELLVKEIFEKDKSKKIQKVYLVNVPDLRGFIHLDTVFNMVGPKAAIAMPYIFGHPDPGEIGTPKEVLQKFVRWLRDTMGVIQTDLSRIPSQEHFEFAGRTEVYERDHYNKTGQVERNPRPAKYFLNQLIEDDLIDPNMITWIGGSPDNYVTPFEHLRVALFEQHNMAGNVFTVSPFRTVAYHRNEITTNALKENLASYSEHSHLQLMSSNEIRTDNGGPHCLTMPLVRE
ncbi:MAG: arginine deiminase family protein [Bacteroidia bacterium]|nr:arginine deiminase family protein [Bacteroidia bacterium]